MWARRVCERWIVPRQVWLRHVQFLNMTFGSIISKHSIILTNMTATSSKSKQAAEPRADDELFLELYKAAFTGLHAQLEWYWR